jgi:hypothetical protein
MAPAEVVQGGAAMCLRRLVVDQAREGKRKTMTNTSDWWVPLEIESVSSPGSLASRLGGLRLGKPLLPFFPASYFFCILCFAFSFSVLFSVFEFLTNCIQIYFAGI